MRVLTDDSGWFTLEVPEDWAASSEDSVTTLRSPSGAATVFFSAARHAQGRQESFGGADFLYRFLEWLGVEADEERIRCEVSGGCRIYAYERVADGAHWSYWSVTDDETALLIGCTSSGPGPEGEQVERMVRSVRLYHSRVH